MSNGGGNMERVLRLMAEKNASDVYLSANTPLGAAPADQCGRVVLSDIHVSGGNTGDEESEDTSDDDIEYPNGCVR